MKGRGDTIQIGSVARIPLRIHASWLVALFVVAASLSLSLVRSAGQLAPLVALVTVAALFAAVVAHEVGHALVARRAGIGVSGITLFVFGGVASLDEEPARPRDEIAIAIAGPIVSALLAVVAFVASRLPVPPIVAEPLLWLAQVNAGIAIFNLLPGLPLDGGCLVHGVLWTVWGDAHRAKIAAARAGRGIAYALFAFAAVRALSRSPGDALWIGLLGWFLLSTANANIAALPTIPANASVATYVRLVTTTGDLRPYLIVEDDRSRGAITIERALRVPPGARSSITVGELAT
jgi:Zn-dependent protease